jgi:short-subunit dehydrogenase
VNHAPDGRWTLNGAVVVVTGASRGIGAASARLLAQRGARVVGVGRDRSALDRIDGVTGGRSIAVDLRERVAADRAIAFALESYGRVDALVVNAGVGHVGPVTAMSYDEVDALVDTNLRAALLISRIGLDAMRANDPVGRVRGAIVFVTSIAGAVPVTGESVYSATKAGVEAFAAAVREEARTDGIRVSTVLPGVVATDLHAARAVPYDRRFPRPLRPETVASVVVGALETGRPRSFVPRWLGFPAWLHGAIPPVYRALARRFG